MKEKYCSEVFLNLQEDIGGKLRESWTEWCHEEFVGEHKAQVGVI